MISLEYIFKCMFAERIQNDMNGRSSRVVLADILKGVAVILMIQVHLMELFALPAVSGSFPGRISLFLGGPPAAPVFMAVMGYFFGRSGKSTGRHLWRGAKLIVLGFLLNLGLNAHLLIKILNGTFAIDPWPYVFGVDILFLAGLSLMLMALFRALAGNRIIPWILLMLVVASANPYLPVYSGSQAWIKYLQACFWGYFSWSYFPVFPWMAYPLLGMVFYLVIQKAGLQKLRPAHAAMAVVLLLIPVVIGFPQQFKIATQLDLYYHHNLLFFLWTTAFLLAWTLMFFLFFYKNSKNFLARYLAWTGKNVTVFYVFQWLLIGNIATAVYRTQNALQLAGWFAGVLTIASLLTLLYKRMAAHPQLLR